MRMTVNPRFNHHRALRTKFGYHYWLLHQSLKKLAVVERLLGSLHLGNEDGDGNENGKKAIILDWRNNNFARTTRFFCLFFAVVARLQVPKFTFCRGREHKTTTFFFFFWTLMQSFRNQLQKHLPTFGEVNEME